MSSDRLAELIRQRALVQEHLAWLDREIVDAQTRSTESNLPHAVTARTRTEYPLAPSSAPKTAVASPLPVMASETAEIDVDEILQRHRVAPATVRSDVRKGCFLYFFAALCLLGLGVAFLYVTIGTH